MVCILFFAPDTTHTPRPLHYYSPAIVVFFLFLEWYKTLFYFRHLHFPVSARNILLTHHFSKYIFLVLQSMCGMFFYSHGTLPVCTFQFALHDYFMYYDPVHFLIAPSNHQYFSLHILLHEKKFSTCIFCEYIKLLNLPKAEPILWFLHNSLLRIYV